MKKTLTTQQNPPRSLYLKYSSQENPVQYTWHCMRGLSCIAVLESCSGVKNRGKVKRLEGQCVNDTSVFLFFCLFVCLVSWLVFGSQSCSEGEDEVLSLQRNQILIGFCPSHNVLKHWNWAESAEDWSGFPGALENALHLHNQALKW